MSTFELDIAISNILSHEDFIAKNTRGNHMYSNARKHYRYFINVTVEEIEPSAYIEQIKNDLQILETERSVGAISYWARNFPKSVNGKISW